METRLLSTSTKNFNLTISTSSSVNLDFDGTEVSTFSVEDKAKVLKQSKADFNVAVNMVSPKLDDPLENSSQIRVKEAHKGEVVSVM
jgi:GTP1/Obg family GTP-binding protein